LVIDAIDDSPISDAIPKKADKFTGESLDVIMSTRITLQLQKAANQLSSKRLVCLIEESLRLR
jgi:hypothetical protein